MCVCVYICIKVIDSNIYLDGRKGFGGIDVFEGKKRLCTHLAIVSSIYIYIYDLIISKLLE
jgi:hypothetical protein